MILRRANWVLRVSGPVNQYLKSQPLDELWTMMVEGMDKARWSEPLDGGDESGPRVGKWTTEVVYTWQGRTHDSSRDVSGTGAGGISRDKTGWWDYGFRRRKRILVQLRRVTHLFYLFTIYFFFKWRKIEMIISKINAEINTYWCEN